MQKSSGLTDYFWAYSICLPCLWPVDGCVTLRAERESKWMKSKQGCISNPWSWLSLGWDWMLLPSRILIDTRKKRKSELQHLCRLQGRCASSEPFFPVRRLSAVVFVVSNYAHRWTAHLDGWGASAFMLTTSLKTKAAVIVLIKKAFYWLKWGNNINKKSLKWQFGDIHFLLFQPLFPLQH